MGGGGGFGGYGPEAGSPGGGAGAGAPKEFVDWTAKKVQAWFRGRRQVHLYEEKRRAASRIQRAWRRFAAASNSTDFGAAAARVQRAWRSYSYRRTFAYYRDMLRFRETTDPAAMLRCINPREGRLADAAAGLHLRFRLGGSCFPPLVLYKIFTHRHVADLGAFAPRDYARESRDAPAESTHNKAPAAKPARRGRAEVLEEDFILEPELREFRRPDGSLGYRNETGWYERLDHNGWRPISDRMLADPEAAAEAVKSSRGTASYHHVPQVRREERERRKREKQREWMVKLYSGGVGPGGGEGQPALKEQLATGLQGGGRAMTTFWTGVRNSTSTTTTTTGSPSLAPAGPTSPQAYRSWRRWKTSKPPPKHRGIRPSSSSRNHKKS